MTIIGKNTHKNTHPITAIPPEKSVPVYLKCFYVDFDGSFSLVLKSRPMISPMNPA